MIQYSINYDHRYVDTISGDHRLVRGAHADLNMCIRLTVDQAVRAVEAITLRYGLDAPDASDAEVLRALADVLDNDAAGSEPEIEPQDTMQQPTGRRLVDL